MFLCRITLRLTCVAVFIFSSVSGNAKILDFLKKDISNIPTRETLKAQEPLAQKKLSLALGYESQGMRAKALSLHQSIVRKYPFTSAAPISQFKIAEAYMASGKQKKAFDAYQNFIDKHKSSASFTQAIQNQYEIARAVQKIHQKRSKFSIVPRKVRKSELLEWFDKIIDTAPYSSFAPLAQFAIAETYENDEKNAMAITAYQALVDKYPSHPKSPEAQFRIGDIARREIQSGSHDPAHVTSARNAMEDVILAYGNSARATEAKNALAQFDAIEAEQYYNTGRFYEKQKQLRSATIYYEKAVNAKDSIRKKDALKRLEILRSNTQPSTPVKITETPKKKTKTKPESTPSAEPGLTLRSNPSTEPLDPIPSVEEKRKTSTKTVTETVPSKTDDPVKLPPPPPDPES